MALQPEVILFDEPTSALDPELVGEVLAVMRKVARRGITMIVVTHEMSFAQDIANQVVFLDGGQVVEKGPPREIFRNAKEDRTRQFLKRIMPEYTYNIYRRRTMADFVKRLPLIRKHLSQNGGAVYVNTGVIGPLSAAAKLALSQAVFSAGEKNGYQTLQEAAAGTKPQIARLINAGPEEIALKNNTTHGIYETIRSLSWQKGDEIVISDVEHHAIIRAALDLQDRYGVVIRYFSTRGGRILDSLSAAFSAKTRLAAFSHVSYITGEKLPAKEIVQAAHEKNVPVLIDGAQAAGAIPVDVRDLGVDYYSLPGQKWLFGPQGTGALYVRKSILDNYDPAVNRREKPFPYQDEKLPTGIRRFEPVLPGGFALAAFGASVEWFLDEVGREDAFAAIAATAGYVREKLAGLEGLRLITPVDFAGLVSFQVLKKDPKELLACLAEKKIFARTVDPFGYVRFSFSYFNSLEEADRLLDSVREFIGS
jgi:L-cysteine/cystine lyase